MKRLVLISATSLVLVLGRTTAHARTVAFFPIGGARAIFTIQNPSVGPSDNDAQKLYEAMNVTPEESFAGVGKGIVTPDRAFNLVCAIRIGNIYSCSLIIQDSDRSAVSPIRRTAEFVVHGEQARELSDLFFKGNDGNFAFQTSEGLFLIEATAAEFRFRYGN